MSEEVLRVEGVYKHFAVKEGRGTRLVKAVDGVSLSVKRGETLAVVGESGSGKSTLARVVLGLLKPDRGRVLLEGEDVTGRLESKWYRSRVQGVFQNPYSSLNPYLKAADLIAEPAVYLRGLSWSEARREAEELAEKLRLAPELLRRYPVELSGGEAQRVAIARALIVKPRLLVLDEPTSALDVSVQAQILRLLVEVKESLGLSYVMITHDMGVARSVSDSVAVMYRGKVVEYAAARELFSNPLHPYTRLLLSSVLEPGRAPEEKVFSSYREAENGGSEGGCRFLPRCPFAFEKCRTAEPEPVNMGKEHSVQCYLYQK